MNINDYLQAASERAGGLSDRRLAQRLDISPNSVSHMRLGQMLPGPDLMVRIAALAGRDARAALLELDEAKAKGDEAKAHYRAIREIVARAAGAAMLAMAAIMLPAPGPALAGTNPAQFNSGIGPSNDYRTGRKRRGRH